MQQEKRRRVFRAGLSVKDGEPIYLCRAIKSRVFHGTFLSLGEQLNDASITETTSAMRESFEFVFILLSFAQAS